MPLSYRNQSIDLQSNRWTGFYMITASVMKELNADFFENFVCKNFNYCLKKGEFPCVLKHPDVIPVHKKEVKSDKAIYRSSSILPNLYKIYEKIMYK